jgi:arylsulfatase A-like enzyme
VTFARACYEELVRQLDRELARLLAELDARGALHNTMVIVTSDHGEQFGEHDLFNHGNSLYRPLTHVPLIVSWPAGISEGRRIEYAVSLTDLGATIADALDWPPQDHLAGSSFWPCSTHRVEPVANSPICSLTGRPHDQHFHYAPVASGAMTAVLHDGLYFIRQRDGTENAFDFARDPLERQDLVANPLWQDAVSKARQALDHRFGSNQRSSAKRRSDALFAEHNE